VEHLDEIIERLQNEERQLNIIDEISKQDDKDRQDTSEN
jgi:hypothetical protein